ncbi:unnamed protein product [Ranitomeya imitator]|uniref:Helix-turn-helix domain-containing protein n=1 Tax=Ranitomeya imitator TaxID=111125 RepID=A0ABN9L1B3_9NEOB|nr:unnamed protein product [Ranitomeya imitator]
MYQPISNNPTFEISKEIKDLVAHYTTIGTVDTKLGEFLVKQHPVTPDTHSSFVVSHAIYWRRYIDDVSLIWTDDVETLLDFHKHLNSSLPGLTFSLSYDLISMNFLDTIVIINENRNIETDLFVKPTDKNSLLKYDSCHPHHIKRALPKSLHDRVDRIVSNPEVSHLRHQEMNVKFNNRDTLIMFLH